VENPVPALFFSVAEYSDLSGGFCVTVKPHDCLCLLPTKRI